MAAAPWLTGPAPSMIRFRCPVVASSSPYAAIAALEQGMFDVATPFQKKSDPGFLRSPILYKTRGVHPPVPPSLFILPRNIAAVNECRAIAGVRTPAWNDDFKEVPTLRTFERPHFVPSGNRREFYDDPFDLTHDTLELGILGPRNDVAHPILRLKAIVIRHWRKPGSIGSRALLVRRRAPCSGTCRLQA
jgi:hypothetical protein